MTDLDARIRDYLSRCENDIGVTDAFHAVLDLHKPHDDFPYDQICLGCTLRVTGAPVVKYPCPTVRAIARELLGASE